MPPCTGHPPGFGRSPKGGDGRRLESQKELPMSDTQPSTKKRPDFLAFAVRPNGDGPRYTRIGVAFANKNGGYSVMYDAVPLSGQIVLVGIDDEKPSTLSYGAPTRKPDFDASMVRDGGQNNA